MCKTDSEHDELMALVKRQQEQIAQLKIASEQLQRQLVEAQRGGRRQAAPFSKGKRSDKPKRPGRKPGTGMFSYRRAPSAEEVTEPMVDVPVSGETCPGCGGSLEDAGESVAYVTDIPAIRRPEVRAYRVQVCRCRSCGKQVRGQHPDIAADQHGASAHRLGERVKAAAHVLHYGVGIPTEGTGSSQCADGCESESGSDQPRRLRRGGGAVGEAYRSLRTSVGASEFVHTETRAGEWEASAFLWLRDGRGNGVSGPCSSPERRCGRWSRTMEG